MKSASSGIHNLLLQQVRHFFGEEMPEDLRPFLLEVNKSYYAAENKLLSPEAAPETSTPQTDANQEALRMNRRAQGYIRRRIGEAHTKALLAQKNEALSQISSNIAHDFNNILTIITGYSKLIRCEAGHIPLIESLVEEISLAAERGAGLTRQILAFSKNQPMNIVVVDLIDLLRKYSGLIRMALGKGIEAEFQLGAPGAPIAVDENQFLRILLNIAINARDAMRKNGKFSIRVAECSTMDSFIPPEISIDRMYGDFIGLEFTDTGPGIAQEHIDHIFKPYFTTKGPGEGTGLGLAVVYGIVKQLGGYIFCESTVGAGTKFRVFFPIAGTEQNFPKRNHYTPI